VTLHRLLQKLQVCPALPAFCGKSLEHFAFAIHGAPGVMRLPVDPDEDLVQVLSALGKETLIKATILDLRGEYWTEPVSPGTHSFVADNDAALEMKIFDLPQ